MVTMGPAAPWAAYLRFYSSLTGLSQPCDKLCAMTEDLDFRSDKSDSAEGGRTAVNRWAGYHHNLDEDVVAQAFSTPAQSMEELDPEIRDAIASDALERSELIGFWVAWHLAAGSTTSSRRLAPGDHLPQDPPLPSRLRRPPRRVALPWIKLDHEKAWSEQVSRPARGAPPATSSADSHETPECGHLIM